MTVDGRRRWQDPGWLLVAALSLMPLPFWFTAIPLSERFPTCFAPIFPCLRDNMTEPRVVLAPDRENTCIPAYSADANVVSVRGSQVLAHLRALERLAGREIEVPQRVLDERAFFSRSTTPTKRWQILRRYNADYVMVYPGGPIDEQLQRLPRLSSVNVPGRYFALYRVDRPGSQRTR